MFSLLLCGCLVFLGWYFLWKPYSYWKERGVPQTKPWPIVGDMWPTLFKKMGHSEQVQWLYNSFPDRRYFGFYHLLTPYLCLRDPQLIKQIAIKDFEHFTDRGDMVDPTLEPLFGNGLFFLNGKKWKDTRSCLSGTFTSSKMKHIFNNVSKGTKNLTRYFNDKKQEVVELEMREIFRRFASDIIASSAFGIEIDSFKYPKNEFLVMGSKLLASLDSLASVLRYLMPSICAAFSIRIMPEALLNYFKNVIDETIGMREKNNIVRNDMINLLLEEKHDVKRIGDEKKHKLIDITNEYIASQALVFFLAGYETLSMAMSFGAYELAVNPDIQKRLRGEILEALSQFKGKITYEALFSMEYMDMFVSEVLRKWCVAVRVRRVCTKSYIIKPTNSSEAPLKIEKGDVLFLPLIAIHRDPKYWPEPEKFDPERFSNKNKKKIVPHTYLPFGIGPRTCIAMRFALMEIKCVFFEILQNNEIVPTEKTQMPIQLEKGNTYGAKGGIWVGIKKAT